MISLRKVPFYIKVSLLLVGLYVLVSMLSIAQSIIIPVIYAAFLAILLSPPVNFLVRHHVNRVVAITSVLLLTIFIVGTVVVFALSQASLISNAMPELTEKFQVLIDHCVHWISTSFRVNASSIYAWIEDMQTDLIENRSRLIGGTLSTVGSILSGALLTPVYIFMILYYKPHLIRFVHMLFGSRNGQNVSEILIESKTIIQSYLVGLFFEFLIVAVLNAVGLLILGLQYAILLAIIGALLNIIPYIGGLVAMAIFAIVAMLTKSPEYVAYVLLMYTFIQLIDNNYIVPKIVGSKVRLNAFISILAVLAGAALWGIPGMLLSIPLIAVLKLIFDRVHSLKPWGFLMGDTMPPMVNVPVRIKSMAKTTKQAASAFANRQASKKGIQ